MSLPNFRKMLIQIEESYARAGTLLVLSYDLRGHDLVMYARVTAVGSRLKEYINGFKGASAVFGDEKAVSEELRTALSRDDITLASKVFRAYGPLVQDAKRDIGRQKSTVFE
jgi:hypothetical protein